MFEIKSHATHGRTDGVFFYRVSHYWKGRIKFPCSFAGEIVKICRQNSERDTDEALPHMRRQINQRINQLTNDQTNKTKKNIQILKHDSSHSHLTLANEKVPVTSVS